MNNIIFLDTILSIENLRDQKRYLRGEVTSSICGYGTSRAKYNENEANPVPIIYPVVARDTMFRFIALVRKNYLKSCRKEYLNK